MARADYRTLGLLNRWPNVMHEDGFRFNQIAGVGTRNTPGANTYIQYERDYIARGLYQAIRRVRDYCGFYPAPEWITDEAVTINADYHWSAQTFETRYGYVEAFGRRAVQLVTPDADVSYEDRNGDQVDETATFTVSGVAAIDVRELQAFFRAADGAAAAASEYWQIDGLTVTKSGDSATFSGPRWLFAHPTNVWATEFTGDDQHERHAGNTKDDDSFVLQVDVYRVYADPTDAVTLLSDPALVGLSSSETRLTAWLTDAENGLFRVYASSDQSVPGATPQGLKISYKAGYPLVYDRMDGQLEEALCRYANTLMPQQPMMGDRALGMWQEDRQLIKKYNMTQASMQIVSAVEPIRKRLKASVPVWFPDASNPT